MQDRYFPGVTFKEHNPTIRDVMNRPFRSGSSITRGRLLGGYPGFGHQPQQEVLRGFVRGLVSLGEEIGEPLSIWKRNLIFVAKDQMLPRTEDHRQQIIETYGEALVNGGAGDCQITDNGTYLLRVVDDGAMNVIDERYSTAAHEYGHSLGKRFLDDPVSEEMKAYAFEQLYMEYILSSIYDIPPVLRVDVHNVALFKLDQLNALSVPLQATIAHLTERPFGKFEPDDYRKFCQV